MDQNSRTFDPSKPAFDIPQFSPLFREGIPVTLNPPFARLLSDLLYDCFDAEQDHPGILAFAGQLSKFVDNCNRFADGVPRVPQKLPKMPRPRSDSQFQESRNAG